MRLKDLEKVKVIAGFPGIGKSDFVKHNKKMKIKDSDSSEWDKDDFPENYLNYIENIIEDGYTILCSTHEDVRNGLEERGISYVLVYPEENLKEEYIKRYSDRGSPETFIDMMNDKWEEFIKSCDESLPYKRIRLKKGQYLSDVINDFI